jgi:hypothetical protein
MYCVQCKSEVTGNTYNHVCVVNDRGLKLCEHGEPITGNDKKATRAGACVPCKRAIAIASKAKQAVAV